MPDTPPTDDGSSHTAITRRRFLALGTMGGALALLLGGSGWVAQTTSTKREIEIFDALSDAFFSVQEQNNNGPAFPKPSSIDAGLHVWKQMQSFPAAVRWQVRGLLRLIEHAPIPTTGSRLSKLSHSEAVSWLQNWSTSRLVTPRLMVQALKQLCAMGTFTRPETWNAIGYDGPTIQQVGL